MSITIGDKVTVELNGILTDGYIIGIRPFRGQQPGYTTVWIEFTDLSGESKPDIQVAVASEDLTDWSIADLENWINENALNHNQSLTAKAASAQHK